MAQGYHKGTVTVTTATTFDSFLRQVSSRIPGLDPQHFHIQTVCSRAGAPPDARQYIPIHENTVSLPFPVRRSILEHKFLDNAFFPAHLQCMHLSVLTVTLNSHAETLRIKLLSMHQLRVSCSCSFANNACSLPSKLGDGHNCSASGRLPCLHNLCI